MDMLIVYRSADSYSTLRSWLRVLSILVFFLSAGVIVAQERPVVDSFRTNVIEEGKYTQLSNCPISLPSQLLDYEVRRGFNNRYVKYKSPNVTLDLFIQLAIYNPDEVDGPSEGSINDRFMPVHGPISTHPVVVPENWNGMLTLSSDTTGVDMFSIFRMTSPGYVITVGIPVVEDKERIKNILAQIKLLPPSNLDIFEELGVRFEVPESFGTSWQYYIKGEFTFHGDERDLYVRKFIVKEKVFDQYYNMVASSKPDSNYYHSDSLGLKRGVDIECYEKPREKDKLKCRATGLVYVDNYDVFFATKIYEGQSKIDFIELMKSIRPLE